MEPRALGTGLLLVGGAVVGSGVFHGAGLSGPALVMEMLIVPGLLVAIFGAVMDPEAAGPGPAPPFGEPDPPPPAF